MSPIPLPFIAKEHYDAIRRVAPDLPATHAGWLNLIHQKQRERSTISSVQLVPVRPTEFVAYCLKRGLRGSVDTLLRFASDNAAGRGGTDEDDGPLETT